LLDVNVLQGWTEHELRRVPESSKVCVPDCCIAEILTKERELAGRLLRRLAVAPGVFVRDVGAHCRWEILNREPVGLLLMHEGAPGFPELAYTPMLHGLQKAFEREDSASAVEKFNLEVDLPSEQLWEQINSDIVKRHNLAGTVNTLLVRKAGPTVFLAAMSEFVQKPRPELEEFIVVFLSSFNLGVKDGDLQTLASRLRPEWVLWRLFYAYLIYFHLNVVENPPSFTHKRLNQRIDLHYIALLNPGMILLTADKEMRLVAEALVSDAKVVTRPDELFRPDATA
jgi:hypothetical protein